MSTKKILKIANAQAFWGDRTEAAMELMKNQPDIDYLTLDYLSEVSLSIMAVQRAKDQNLGYARDFVDVVASLVPFWMNESKVKVITNGGGLDPKKCAFACADLLRKVKCTHLRIGIVSGDDVLELLKNDPDDLNYANLETKQSLSVIEGNITTANAYIGAKSIVEALELGADIVITGRVADPSLTVAPCVAHFGWNWNDYNRLAQATLAGHIIECGTQVTGGISTNWLKIPHTENLGFPIVEVDESGDFIVTKPQNCGGLVSIDTVKEQILYEIGDPNAYLSPDVTLSLLDVTVVQIAENRVSVKGANGRPPPPKYKVSATYRDGYRSEGTLSIFGRQAVLKAKQCAQIILEDIKNAGYEPERYCVECLGGGDLVPGTYPQGLESHECVLRLCIADHRMDVMEYFSKQIAPLVTAGPPGTTGYITGRPHVRPVFGYWPCLIPIEAVAPHVECFEVNL